jgi:hypothetical protein
MDQQKSTNSGSIQVDDTVTSADGSHIASAELTEISAESLEWVAGGPNGIAVVIG